MGDASNVFGLYVEKEYVGKRVKGSKVKVCWKFAAMPDLKTNEVELKHSIVFGKREIKLNGELIYQGKKMFTGNFQHHFSVAGHLIVVSIRDEFEGYVYDLQVDGCPFHKLTRISIEMLEEMRKSKQESESFKDVKKMSFNDFVKSDTGGKDKKDKKGEKKKEKKKSKKDSDSSDSSSDSSDSEAEEDLWKAYEKNRKAVGKPVQPTAKTAGQKEFGWTEDPFSTETKPARTTSTNDSVYKLAAGLEGLDFSTPSYQPTGAVHNPFSSPPMSSSTPYGAPPPSSSSYGVSTYSNSPYSSSSHPPPPTSLSSSFNPYDHSAGLQTYSSSTSSSSWIDNPYGAPPSSYQPHQADPSYASTSSQAHYAPPSTYGSPQYNPYAAPSSTQGPPSNPYPYSSSDPNSMYSNGYHTQQTTHQAPYVNAGQNVGNPFH